MKAIKIRRAKRERDWHAKCMQAVKDREKGHRVDAACGQDWSPELRGFSAFRVEENFSINPEVKPLTQPKQA